MKLSLKRTQRSLVADLVSHGQFSLGGVKLFEAATGCGKTACYLHAARELYEKTGKQVTIAVPTNLLVFQTLAEIEKFDLPKKMYAGFVGMSHFVSPEALEAAISEGILPVEANEFLNTTETGFVSDLEAFLFDLGVDIPEHLESLVGVDPHSYAGEKELRESERAFYLDQIDRAAESPVLITNHTSILLPHVINWNGLPQPEYLVIDEAHTLPYAAAQLLSHSFSPYRTRGALRHLGKNTPGFKPSAFKKAKELSTACIETFANGKDTYPLSDESQKEFLTLYAETLSDLVKEIAKSCDSESKTNGAFWPRWLVLRQEVRELKTIVRALRSQTDKVICSLSEKKRVPTLQTQRDQSNFWLQKKFWPNTPCPVAACSGTVTMFKLGSKQSSMNKNILGHLGIMGEIRERLPDPWVQTYRFPTHSDRITVTTCERDFPEPGDDDWLQRLAERISETVSADTRTMVLVGSYENASDLQQALSGSFPKEHLLVSEKGISPKSIISRFEKGILIGTRQYWTGLDVADLDHLVIGRLPFPVHGNARWQTIRERSPKLFWRQYLWETILTYRQGCGRLIRNATNTGTIHLLDARIYTNKSIPLEAWISWAKGQKAD